jgi:hypothetical protein
MEIFIVFSRTAHFSHPVKAFFSVESAVRHVRAILHRRLEGSATSTTTNGHRDPKDNLMFEAKVTEFTAEAGEVVDEYFVLRMKVEGSPLEALAKEAE